MIKHNKNLVFSTFNIYALFYAKTKSN